MTFEIFLFLGMKTSNANNWLSCQDLRINKKRSSYTYGLSQEFYMYILEAEIGDRFLVHLNANVIKGTDEDGKANDYWESFTEKSTGNRSNFTRKLLTSPANFLDRKDSHDEETAEQRIEADSIYESEMNWKRRKAGKPSLEIEMLRSTSYSTVDIKSCWRLCWRTSKRHELVLKTLH